MKTIASEVMYRVKIKGDAGAYLVYAIDLLGNRLYVARNCGNEWVDVKKIQELMRWTGFRDCEGIPIYFGDILRVRFDDEEDPNALQTGTALVVEGMNNGMALLYDEKDGDGSVIYAVDEGGLTQDFWEDADLWTVEVIGNKYEDKHLLNGYAPNTKKSV